MPGRTRITTIADLQRKLGQTSSGQPSPQEDQDATTTATAAPAAPAVVTIEEAVQALKSEQAAAAEKEQTTSSGGGAKDGVGDTGSDAEEGEEEAVPAASASSVPAAPRYTPEEQKQIDELREEAVEKMQQRKEALFKRQSTTARGGRNQLAETKKRRPNADFRIPARNQGVAAYLIAGPENAHVFHSSYCICWCGNFSTLAVAKKQFKRWMKPGKKTGRIVWRMGKRPLPEPLYVSLDFPFYIGHRMQIIPENCTEEEKAYLKQGNIDFIMRAKKNWKLKLEMGEQAFDDYMDTGGLWNNDGPDGPEAEFDNKTKEEMETRRAELEEKMEKEGKKEVDNTAYPRKCKNTSQSHQAMSVYWDPADKSVLKQNFFLTAYGTESDPERCYDYVHDCVARQRKKNGFNIPMQMYVFVPLDLINTADFHNPDVVRQIHTTQDQAEMAEYAQINRERAREVNEVYEEGGFTANLTPADPGYKPSPEELHHARRMAEEVPWEDERPRRTRIAIAKRFREQPEPKASEPDTTVGGGGVATD
jgi:hypothetical protein